MFHERFDISVGIDEAQKRFVNRVHNTVWTGYVLDLSPDRRFRVEKAILSALGQRYEHIALSAQIGDEFLRNLQALEALYGESDYSGRQEVEPLILQVLSLSEVDLGIEWNDERFHRKGAHLLDEKLVNDVLSWMRQPGYEVVVEPYERGMNHFLQAHIRNDALADVITDLYEAVEALAKIVTNRHDKDLSSNREQFLSKLTASEAYKPLLREYIDYACRFRHAASERKPKPNIPEREVESFVYMTGIFIRLAMPDNSSR